MTEISSDQTSAAANSKAHFEWVDILRGLSALGVVFFHVRIYLWTGWRNIHAHPHLFSAFDRATAYLSLCTPFMGSLVMLFFLVSGFCIHYPYSKGRDFELRSYLSRRLLRIYPPYLGAIIFSIGVELILYGLYHVPMSPYRQILRCIFMVENYGFSGAPIYSDGALWSLPVEVELYLFYPIFLWVSLRYGLKSSMVMAATVSAIALLISFHTDATMGWYHASRSFALYWIIWCSGAYLASKIAGTTTSRWRPIFFPVSAILLIAAIFLQLRNLPQGFQHLTWAAFYYFVLLWGLNRPGGIPLPNCLRRPLATLGLISYSLYLVHMPFLLLCGKIWVRTFGDKPANFLVSVCFSIIVLPVAYVFYRYVELPSHKLARIIGKSNTEQTQPSGA